MELLEGIEEADCIIESSNEVVNFFSGVVEVETCTRASIDI